MRSTATPTLDGTYVIDPPTQANITATVLSRIANAVFPDGSTAGYEWPDLSGVMHAFPTCDEFQAFATSAAAAVSAIEHG